MLWNNVIHDTLTPTLLNCCNRFDGVGNNSFHYLYRNRTKRVVFDTKFFQNFTQTNIVFLSRTQVDNKPFYVLSFIVLFIWGVFD
jgi:hypothetical protein